MADRHDERNESASERRDRGAGLCAYFASRTDPMERLGLFLDDHPGAAARFLPPAQAESGTLVTSDS
jgi:hypothetical protein